MEKEQSGKTLFRGELALVIAVLVNSFVLRRGNFGHFQRAVCVFAGVPGTYAGNLDLPVPGHFDCQPDDYAPQMGVAIPVQLCSGLCVQ